MGLYSAFQTYELDLGGKIDKERGGEGEEGKKLGKGKGKGRKGKGEEKGKVVPLTSFVPNL